MRPTGVRAVAADDCDALGLITVAASFKTFLGQIPEAQLDLTWTPGDSAQGWRRSLAELATSDLFDVYDDAELGVIGFVWAGPSDRVPGAGEIRGLYVLPTQQGRGIGRRLLAHAAGQLHDRSLDAVVVGCIRENPSCAFYRHLGGVESFTEPSTVDEFETEEVFFVWSDITKLI